MALFPSYGVKNFSPPPPGFESGSLANIGRPTPMRAPRNPRSPAPKVSGRAGSMPKPQPLTDLQVAQNSVSQMYDPVLRQIKDAYNQMIQSTGAQYNAGSKQLADLYGQYGPRVQQAYSQAGQGLAAVQGMLAATQQGQGVSAASDLARQLQGIDASTAGRVSGNFGQNLQGEALANATAGGNNLAALLAEGAHAGQYGAILPGVGGQIGFQGLQQALGTLNANQKDELAKLTATEPGAVQDALAGIQKQHADQSAATAKAAAAQAKTSAPNASLSRALGYEVDSNGNPILRGGKVSVLPGFTVNGNGQVIKTPTARGGAGARGAGGASKYSISSSLSKQTGFWTDSHGNIITGANGAPIPWKKTPKGATNPPTANESARWNGELQKGYATMPAGTSYTDFLSESVQQNVPLGYAIAFANKKWPTTQRATPEQIAGIAGATGKDVAASGAPAQQNAYQQTIGAAAPQQYALSRLAAYGWNNAAQAQALNALWTRESGWSPIAKNPTSGALGIPQELGHKVPADYATNPHTQIDWGLNYIRQRYGSPAAAWAHEQQHGWY